MKKKIKIIRFSFNILNVILIISIAFISYYLIYTGTNSYNEKNIKYYNKSNVDYKVYLKENSFFDTDYLGMNRTYISSLINYIDVTLNYNVSFSDKVSGNYSYYVKGTMTADKTDNSNSDSYWTKEYILKEVENVEYDKQEEINISTNIQIDYQKYNDLLQKFKNEYGLSFNGLFKLELVFDNFSTSTLLDTGFVINNTTGLTIPLTQKTVDLSINLDANDNSNAVTEKYKIVDVKHIIFGIIGMLLILVDLFLIVNFISRLKKNSKKVNQYDKKLKKILSTYDSIIVNVKNKPELEYLNVVYVKDFSELIDAHSETRLPINYYEEIEGKLSLFLLIFNDIAWVYVLKNKD